MKKVILVSMAALFALCIGSAAAFAGTPDGITPNAEEACDGETGKAKGLCVAFCEAQDCDENPSDTCDTLRDNWTSITGETSFPCEVKTLCPCFSKQMILEQFGLVGDPADEVCEQFSTSFSKLGVRGKVTQVKKVGNGTSRAFNAQDWPEVYESLQICENYEGSIRRKKEPVSDELMDACLGELQAVAAQFSLVCSAN